MMALSAVFLGRYAGKESDDEKALASGEGTKNQPTRLGADGGAPSSARRKGLRTALPPPHT